MEVIDYSKLRKRGKGQGLNTGLVVKAQASKGPDPRDTTSSLVVRRCIPFIPASSLNRSYDCPQFLTITLAV
jgi:hypothetical protein